MLRVTTTFRNNKTVGNTQNLFVQVNRFVMCFMVETDALTKDLVAFIEYDSDSYCNKVADFIGSFEK